MSRDAAVRAEGYARAADAIAPELDAGRDVAMVNLGDVSIYATAYYVLDELRRRGYDTRMSPALRAFPPWPAALGRSLTEMELRCISILPERPISMPRLPSRAPRC